MHPAYSVIFFTTLSGAGYGLLICLATLYSLGAIPPAPLLGLLSLGSAFALISIGLLASTLHLGRPSRAWRAFSQWRTSWLSREGVLSIASFIPAGFLAIGWIWLGTYSTIFVCMAVATVGLSLATVYCTGMIYQSLPTIRAWHQPLVTPIYVVLAIATGSLLALFILRTFFIEIPPLSILTIAALLLGAALKRTYWRIVANAPRTFTAGQAIGLASIGDVRPLDPPHGQANFVMREMGFVVGRKHAEKLRGLILGAGFLAPAVLLAVALVTIPIVATFLTGLAIVSCAIGIFTERWLFFAEAQHVVTLYYGAKSA